MNALATQVTNSNEDLSSVPAKWRVEVDAWVREFGRLANGLTTKHEIAKVMSCNISSVNRKLRIFKQSGALGLAPDYKGPKALPDAFIDYWRNLVEDYQRATSPAFRELVRRWRKKEPIDGYPGHPGWPNLPKGWGTDGRNLRRHQGTKLEIVAMREGLGKATARHAPKVLTTRVGLWHLSHIAFDDVWLNMNTTLLTSPQIVRVMELGAADILSGCRFMRGTKPRIVRADGTRENLNEADMRFALASVLFNHGISPRGTTLLVEHGTAAIRSRVRDILKRGLGDLIQIPDGGMTGKEQILVGMHEGRGGGNPRHKSPLESLHNLIQNEQSALPAQTGNDRVEPEFLHGIRKETEWLFQVAKQLPPNVLHELQFPSMEYYSQLLPALEALDQVINGRDWHNLEGWAECGFITTDYRISADSNEWITGEKFLALPAPARAALMAVAEADKRCMLPRKMSPREVYERGRSMEGAVMTVPQGIIAEILYEDLAQPRKVRDGYILIQDKEVAPEPMHFESRILRADGREEELRDGETFDVVVNPFDPRFAWIFAARRQAGVFLGLAKRVQRPSRADAKGIQIALGRQLQRMADLTSDMKRRHAGASNGLTRRTLKRVKHNADIIANARQGMRDMTQLAAAALDASLPTENQANETTPNEDHDTIHYSKW